ncbi:MAG: hypothetical protein ISS45_08600 [Candidatus Omnitrophica bacterium]|nr:hypothetical protein [Candidatus Omnitrophota bacterium]
MQKNKVLWMSVSFLAAFVCLAIAFDCFAADETITLTTYYPSPYGVYDEFRAKKMAVGETYYDSSQHCWPGGPCASPDISDQADLIVEGRVGIGTTSPNTELEISNNAGTGQFSINRDDTSIISTNWIGDIRFSGNDPSPGSVGAIIRATAKGEWGTAGDSTDRPTELMFYTAPDGGAPQSRLVIDEDGKVGIGTPDPSGILHVNSSGHTYVDLESPDNKEMTIRFKEAGVTKWRLGMDNTPAPDDFIISQTNNANPPEFIITTTGNVGIGTTTPQNKLDIEGGVAIGSVLSGSFTAPSNGAIIQGNVGIGTGVPATSAKLDIYSTTGALLVPRMTLAQRNGLTAVNGMIIYNQSIGRFEFYENGAWVTKQSVP